MWTMLLLLGGMGLLVGCAAPGPPLPPLLGPGPWGGVAWILLAAIGVGIYLLIRKNPSRQDNNFEHLAETLNDIHERLRRLEEKIDLKAGKNDEDE